MASIWQSSTVLSHTSSYSLSFLLPKNMHKNPRTWNLQSLKPFSPKTQKLAYPPQQWNHSKRTLIRSSTLDETPSLDPPESPDSENTKPEVVASLKLKLLIAISGLNRGLAANEEDLKNAEAAAKELEAAGGLVDLSTDLDKIQGRWKLIYSSAFASHTLGRSGPGPLTGVFLPITLGQVFQRIDILSKDFDNIVELQLFTPWLPMGVTATLAHKFELLGSAKVKITFEKTIVMTTGNLSQLPPLELPQIPDALRPSSNRRSGEFEVTYLDADTRITRGDRDELRVFLIS